MKSWSKVKVLWHHPDRVVMHRRGILLGLLSSWGEFRECQGNFGVYGGCNGEIGCIPQSTLWKVKHIAEKEDTLDHDTLTNTKTFT